MKTQRNSRERDRSPSSTSWPSSRSICSTLRTQAVTEKLEDPSQLGKTRKEIARIKTILRQREVDGGQDRRERSKRKTNNRKE